MHVPIEQAGDEETVISLNDLGVFANRVIGVFANKGNMPICDGDVCMWDDFAGLDADPLPVFDDQVGGRAPHGNVDEGLRKHGSPICDFRFLIFDCRKAAVSN
jgi:hypothetical protein